MNLKNALEAIAGEVEGADALKAAGVALGFNHAARTIRIEPIGEEIKFAPCEWNEIVAQLKAGDDFSVMLLVMTRLRVKTMMGQEC